jgi:hypothetical protein
VAIAPTCHLHLSLSRLQSLSHLPEVFKVQVQRPDYRSPPLSLTLSDKDLRLDNSQKPFSSAVSLNLKQVMAVSDGREF